MRNNLLHNRLTVSCKAQVNKCTCKNYYVYLPKLLNPAVWPISALTMMMMIQLVELPIFDEYLQWQNWYYRQS